MKQLFQFYQKEVGKFVRTVILKERLRILKKPCVVLSYKVFQIHSIIFEKE